jgi:hypothetical protein
MPNDLKEKIKGDISNQDPSLKRLDMVGTIAQHPDENLTELSFDETVDYSVIEALTDAGVLDLSMVVTFLRYLRINRTALDRKRVDEYLRGIAADSGPIQPYVSYGAPGTVEPEKKGIVDTLMFWRK